MFVGFIFGVFGFVISELNLFGGVYPLPQASIVNVSVLIAAMLAKSVMFGIFLSVLIGAVNNFAFKVGCGLFFCIGVIPTAYDGLMIATSEKGDIICPYPFLLVILIPVGYFRLYYFPLDALCWWMCRKPSMFGFHPAAWDWCCWIPFRFLKVFLHGLGRWMQC
jgi:hypothetical protein